jgi:hypothetical protein
MCLIILYRYGCGHKEEVKRVCRPIFIDSKDCSQRWEKTIEPPCCIACVRKPEA